MNRKWIFSGLAAGALALSGLAAIVPGASAMPVQNSLSTHTVQVCAAHVQPGHVSCLAMAVTGANGKIAGSAKPLAAAFSAADIEKAYGLTGLKSGGRTVAIVDAYGYSGLAADLAVFRSTNGLPACTTTSGCLTIVNQTGGSSLPGNNNDWDVEQALDVDMVSAACPDCKILMVQGTAATFADLETAENTAAAHTGVVAISNSYSGSGGSNSAAYNHPGVAITASTGDDGYDPGAYPAGDTHVVAVGGTSVFKDSSTRGFHETAWDGAGSGCSTNAKPAWQNKANTTCNTKATADVSGAADPDNGGLNIYCATDSECGGFLQVGGTSESSPLIAAVFALSGKTTQYPAKFLYKPANKAFLYDVTSGSNGSCGIPLCTARVGWDGPTGMGTPNGVKAF